MATLDFDANTVEPSKPLDPIPVGKYLAIITESEMRDTKDGHGQYLAMTMEVIDGEYEGRKLFDNLNLVNRSTQAVEIARGKLSAICRAVGVMRVLDSCQLHNIPLTIKVVMERRDDTGEMKNVIKSYSPKSDYAGKPQSNRGPATVPPGERNDPGAAPF